jgi:HTH-type transcriptional regulator, transcriptional repressor of NAD biosynthesis genes
VWARTRWVTEYGRDLTVQKLDRLRRSRPGATVDEVVWDHDDFARVAATQNAREDAAARDGAPILFGDTDALATTIWQERYLGRATAAVRDQVRRPDLYLLTDDAGVPFVDDGLRDGEQIRSWMTGRFRAELAASGVPHLVLTGGYAERLRAAVSACDALLARGWDFAPPLSGTGSVGREVAGQHGHRDGQRHHRPEDEDLQAESVAPGGLEVGRER